MCAPTGVLTLDTDVQLTKLNLFFTGLEHMFKLVVKLISLPISRLTCLIQ